VPESTKAFARNTNPRRRTPLPDNPGGVSYWQDLISLNLNLLVLVNQGKGRQQKSKNLYSPAPSLPCSRSFSPGSRYPKATD